MAEFKNLPGVKISEVQLGSPPIIGAETSRAGFVGTTPRNTFKDEAKLVTSADQFNALYVRNFDDAAADLASVTNEFALAVLGFFQNGGTSCYVVNVGPAGDVGVGIDLLEKFELQIVAAPGSADTMHAKLKDHAARMGERFAILDPKAATGADPTLPVGNMYSAFYYPRIKVTPQLPLDLPKDPLKPKDPLFISPSGHIAGVYARTDGNRGVHKAPANEVLLGVIDLEDLVTDARQNVLNESRVNVIRAFDGAPIVWGARTLAQNITSEVDYKYVPIRRLTTFIEQSLKRSLRFAVFEPNNLALRKTITRSVRAFLDGVWRDGALFGAVPDEAYYVRFPENFNTDSERAAGKLTMEIGIRVAYPVEFLIIRIGLLSEAANAA
jgi:phage tail sheath protein FI